MRWKGNDYMSKGFISSIDLDSSNKELKQEQVKFINKQSEIEAACIVKGGPHYAKPGAIHSGPPSTGISLKVEQTFGGTTINGKEFNELER